MQPRLKSSFIYLANAVNDLRGNWPTLALALAPLVVVAALCLLPDALNIQHGLAEKFAPGARSVAWIPVQIPYQPSADLAQSEFPQWALTIFHWLVFAVTLAAQLLVLCAIRRWQSGLRKPGALAETIEIYRDAARNAAAFAWVVILQLGLPTLAFKVLELDLMVPGGVVAAMVYLALVILMLAGSLIFLWLYFAPYALIFNQEHSFRALLASRDLLRKRFFRVTTRIVVFLAVWSGFNAWVLGFFAAVSIILGPLAILTGYIGAAIFLINLATLAVTYATNVFLIAAGYRLYQDLREAAAARASAAMPATAPLADLSAPAAR